MTNDPAYTPQAPSLVVPTARSGLELELYELNRARHADNLLDSLAVRMNAWAARKAYEAVEKKFAAQKAALDQFNAVSRATGEAREEVMKRQVQQELLQLRHDFALQGAITHLHTVFNEETERLHVAQRASLTARYGVEAAAKFKDLNFALGATRKEAAIAETAEVLPQIGNGKAGKTTSLENLWKLRSELRADGKDTTRIDDAINEAAAKLGISAE